MLKCRGFPYALNGFATYNLRKPPYTVNNGEESPASRYKMYEFFSQKKLSGAPKFCSRADAMPTPIDVLLRKT
jgi:hypothetical protein